MKEATGDLNATVIVVVIVAMLVAFFYFTIWPSLRNNMNENIACSKAICPADGGCVDPGATSVQCQIYDDEGHKVGDPITCPNKGYSCNK